MFRWLRLARYGAEIVVATVALWMSLLVFAALAMRFIVASRFGPELPLFFFWEMAWVWSLVVAYYCARSIVSRVERFWVRFGW